MADTAAVGSTPHDLPVPASVGRRAAALVLDLLLLAAGLVLTLAAGVSIVSATLVEVLLLAWVFVLAPLYFALYHAYGGPEGGPGATPGQHELRISLCDARSGGRLDLGRALARAYGGLFAALLVLPALVDLGSLLASRQGRAWHDRLFRSTVRVVPRPRPELQPSLPTTPRLAPLFESDEGSTRQLLRRGRGLVRGDVRRLVGSTLLVYVGLTLLVSVLGALTVLDAPDDLQASAEVYWLLGASLVLVSGIYWTQAALVVAVEELRRGSSAPPPMLLLRTATRRANALSVAAVVLGLLYLALQLVIWLPFAAVLPLGRLGLVVPALVLEDETVLGAFRRSWSLTRGRTGAAVGLVFASALVLTAALGVLGLAAGTAGAVLSATVGPGTGLVGAAVVGLLGLLPFSAILAVLGSAWCLFYHDLRRRAEPSAGEV